jgi:eukaryotic-like serine/threonine-protein kinase
MLATGFRVEGYVIARHAVTSGMSEVYETRHAQSGERAALKVLLSEWLLDPELMTRFRNEALALEGFRHRRIVALLGHGALPAGEPYMLLEWLPQSLEQALFAAPGALPASAAVRVAAQIAEGLTALHDRGLVHRDLKPANVLLDREDIAKAELKLADLGFAKRIQEQAFDPANPGASPLALLPISTGGSEMLGSMDYMAPEQWIKSKDADPRADVYALGVLLFQMLTGSLPFLGETDQELMRLHLSVAPPLRSLDGRAAPALRALIAQMLGKKPATRPSMSELQERLDRLG